MALRRLVEPGVLQWADVLAAMEEVSEFRGLYSTQEVDHMRRRLGTMHRARHPTEMRFDIWFLDALLLRGHADIMDKWYTPHATKTVADFGFLPAHLQAEFSETPFLSFTTKQCMEMLISLVQLVFHASVGPRPLALNEGDTPRALYMLFSILHLRVKLLAVNVLPAEYFDDEDSKDNRSADGLQGWAGLDWIREAYHLAMSIEGMAFCPPHATLLPVPSADAPYKAYLKRKAGMLKPHTRVAAFQEYLARVSLCADLHDWHTFKFERLMEGVSGRDAQEVPALQKVTKLDLDFGLDLRGASLDLLATHPHFDDFALEALCKEVLGCSLVFHPGLPLRYLHAARIWVYAGGEFAAPSVCAILVELVEKNRFVSDVQCIDDTGLETGLAIPASFFRRVFVDADDAE